MYYEVLFEQMVFGQPWSVNPEDQIEPGGNLVKTGWQVAQGSGNTLFCKSSILTTLISLTTDVSFK